MERWKENYNRIVKYVAVHLLGKDREVRLALKSSTPTEWGRVAVVEGDAAVPEGFHLLRAERVPPDAIRDIHVAIKYVDEILRFEPMLPSTDPNSVRIPNDIVIMVW